MNCCFQSLKVCLSVCLLVLFCESACQADEVQLEAAKDTSIYSENGLSFGTGNNSNGGSISLFVGRIGDSGGSAFRRALLGFDISSSIPAGATINSVELDLSVFRNSTRDAAPSDVFSLHRLNSDWGEGTVVADPINGLGGLGAAADNGDATWFSNFHNSSTWSTAGGDFQASPSASSIAGPLVDNLGSSQLVTWSGAGLVNDIQYWLDNPSSNFGWILVGDPANGEKSARIFGSRERSSGTPLLTINFTKIPEPSAAILGMLVIASWGLLPRQRQK